MTGADFFYVISWWLIWLTISIIFLPITFLLFKSFFDKGYAFSKILGIMLISYSVWLIASIKIIPFNYFLICSSILVFLIINGIILIKNNLLSNIKNHLKIFIFEELLFLIAFLFWSFIKAYEPSIHGLEKFMDFGFINSILRSDYFPPKDLWLTPNTINYYYFGHFVSALFIKLSGISPEIGYNLTLTSLFGLCISASFSIGANLYYFFSKSSKILLFISGFLSAFLVTLGGNLHTIYIFFQNYNTENPVPFWSLPMMQNISGYWYPNATRFIPFTIHEFPSYSFVVSDLHGHVLDIPFVLLIIAVLITVYLSPKLTLINYLLLALLISIFLMTNFLDAPIYLLTIFIILFAKEKNFQSITSVIKQTVTISVLAIIFSLPFWLSFKPFGSGVGIICAPQFLININQIGPFLFEVDHCTRSPLWMLLILWGFPLFILLAFIYSKIKISVKGINIENLHPIDLLVFTLAITALILILIPEFAYVKDIYPAHWRANTVFKFGYQAFIIFGLISGVLLTRLFASKKNTFWFLPLCFFLFILVTVYPYFSVNSYFGQLQTYRRLNGLNWLNNSYPSDFQAIAWINNNITGQPVILEAQGDSYTDYARVSVNTGLPTVIGWPVHEWLWRGSYDEAGRRLPEVTDLYESSDLNLTKQLIQKYNIEYVFIGSLERQKYTKLDEIKFQKLGTIVFQDKSTRVYKIN